MDWAAAAIAGMIAGIFFERWQCNACKHVLGSTYHGGALDRAYDRATDTTDKILIDEVRVFVNRRGLGL